MPVPGIRTQDLASMFNGFFDTPATYTPNGGAAVTIPVIYNAQNESATVYIGDVAASMPQATCKTSDVPNATNKDTLVVGGVTYQVFNVGNDGSGLTVLTLSIDSGQ